MLNLKICERLKITVLDIKLNFDIGQINYYLSDKENIALKKVVKVRENLKLNQIYRQ